MPQLLSLMKSMYQFRQLWRGTFVCVWVHSRLKVINEIGEGPLSECSQGQWEGPISDPQCESWADVQALSVIPVPRRWRPCRLASQNISMWQLWAQVRDPASMNKVQKNWRWLMTPKLRLHLHVWIHAYSWAHLQTQCALTHVSTHVHIQACAEEQKWWTEYGRYHQHRTANSIFFNFTKK